jgi:hypothetical protein
MRTAKAAMAILVVALATSAIASTTASATTAGWMAGGTNIATTTVALASTAAVDKKFELNGGGLNIECTSANDFIDFFYLDLIPPRLLFVHFLWPGCTTTNANCTIPATLTTVAGVGEPTLQGALAAGITWKPSSGTAFATVKFSGELCAVAGVKAITGDFNSSLTTGQDERTSQLLEVNVTSAQNLLFIASSAASLSDAVLLKLESGQSWSFL